MPVINNIPLVPTVFNIAALYIGSARSAPDGYVPENLNQKISLEDLARIMDLDKFKFIRFFKKQLGMTPFNYITMLRIEQGKTFLQQGKTLIDAALDAGFYDQSHFSRCFKQIQGLTPSKYRTANLPH